MNSGFIALHRKIIDWEWYNDVNTTRVFIHLLMTANHKNKNWRGIVIKRSQIVTSRSKLAEETGLTEQQVRTSLNRLKSTSNITSTSTSKYTVITVCNYGTYQDIKTEHQPALQPALQPASNQQATSKQPQLNNDNNETKKEKPSYEGKKKSSKRKPPEFVIPAYEIVEAHFLGKYSNVKKSYIKRAYDYYNDNNWCNSKGKPVKNWKTTIDNNWMTDGKREDEKPKPLNDWGW